MMKPFTLIAVVVFACVALLQLVRLIEAWPVSIHGFAVPPSGKCFHIRSRHRAICHALARKSQVIARA